MGVLARVNQGGLPQLRVSQESGYPTVQFGSVDLHSRVRGSTALLCNRCPPGSELVPKAVPDRVGFDQSLSDDHQKV